MLNTINVTTQQQLQDTFDLRILVFVDEQGVPLEDELDEYDTLNAPCNHLLLTLDNTPIGCGRVRQVDGVGKLERIVVKKENRGMGFGKAIVLGLEKRAIEMGLNQVKLHGQVQARGFYENLGFAVLGDEFIEDGILHVVMTKQLQDVKDV